MMTYHSPSGPGAPHPSGGSGAPPPGSAGCNDCMQAPRKGGGRVYVSLKAAQRSRAKAAICVFVCVVAGRVQVGVRGVISGV